MEQDYYSVLQISPDAELSVIEGAYLHLTQKYHPDLNDSPDAPARMKEINRAYDVLSDPAKRAAYDRQRKNASGDAAGDSRWRAFIQILETEQNHEYRDDTLMSGLDAYAQLWARRFGTDSAEVQTRAASVAAFLQGYATMSREERARAITQAMARAKNEPVPPYRTTRPVSYENAARSIILPRLSSRRKYLWLGLLIAGVVAAIALAFALTRGTAFAPGATTDRCPQGCTTPPPGCQIKGNINPATGEKIYHLPGDEFYDTTTITPSTGERWFCLEEEAIANGWRHARK